MFYKTLCFFNNHFSNLHVARCRFVKGRTDHFALHGALHIGHLFRPFVDQQYDDVGIRMILLDHVRHLLQQDGFSGSWGRNNQSSLAQPNWSDQVDDASAEVRRLGGQAETLSWVQRSQVVKEDFAAEVAKAVKG